MDPDLRARVEATGAHVLELAGRVYAQFAHRPEPAQLASLATLLDAHPQLWLRTYGFGILRDVGFLRALPTARRLRFEHGPIKDWSGLRYLHKDLEALEIGAYGGRVGLEEIARRTGLRTLALELPVPARDHPRLAALTALEHLTLASAPSARVCEAVFAALPALRTLELRRGAPGDLAWLRHLPRLEALTLSSARGLVALDAMPALPALRSLRLLACATLERLDGLERQPALTSLLVSAARVRELSPITALAALESLGVGWMRELAALPDLGAPARLRRLDLFRLPALTDLAPIARAQRLERLAVTDMRHLKPEHFRPLAGMASLRVLLLGLGSASKHAQVRALVGV